MAVVGREELLKRLAGVIGESDDDLTLMEDLDDTIKSYEERKIEVDWEAEDNPYKKRSSDLARKYKERFYGTVNEEPDGDIYEDDVEKRATIYNDMEIKRVTLDDVLKEGL